MKESRDILSLFERLNSHEVFTPPRVARQMLDLLPAEIWSDPSIKILDPCTKSGVFLRESFFRLFTFLDGKGIYETENGDIYDLDDKQQRINHILKNMLFGIATSELTSYVSRRTLYGVMRANSDKQISSLDAFMQSSNYHQWTEEERSNFIGRNEFNQYFDHNLFCTPDYEGFEEEGNIFYPNDEVKKLVMEEDDYEIEDKYFPFIEENTKHKKILEIRGGEMKFDVIIGNPPYQVDTGGSGRQAKPIYQDFISKCKKLSPKYLIMIIPARWYAGGFGLYEFRKDMLSDRRVKTLVDYENASVVFPGVDIAGGVCYFLWDSKYDGPCNIINARHKDRPEERRYLDEFDIFVRDSRAISILRKVVESNEAKENGFLNDLVTGIRPFGLPTNYKPKDKGVPCWFIQKYGLRYADFNDFTDKLGIIGKWKVLVPKAPIAGQTDFTKPIKIYHEKNVLIAEPGEICTESYIVAGAFDNEVEANNYRKYLFSKIARFLILMTTISQDINKKNYRFVPDLGSYYDTITDRDMRFMWDISDEEWDYIDSRIKCIYE